MMGARSLAAAGRWFTRRGGRPLDGYLRAPPPPGTPALDHGFPQRFRLPEVTKDG